VARTSPAIPFDSLPGVNPEWSRFIDITEPSGAIRTIHLLDTHALNLASPNTTSPVVTLLCVHGNPTWSYLWRGLLGQAPEHVRVIAIDQVGMGYSERVPDPRTLAERVADLESIVQAVGITGPIVTVAHDWGGPISLGWVEQAVRTAAHHIVGVVLLNTAVHQPTEFRGPGLIRMARARGLLAPVTQHTQLFVRGTTLLSGRRIPREVARAYALPYATAHDRGAVRGFVADIPMEPEHVSRPTLDAIAASLDLLADTPVLLIWGPRDPVFSDQYLRDLIKRMPHADVHRCEQGSHLVSEDCPQVFPEILRWVSSLQAGPTLDNSASETSMPVDIGASMQRRAESTPHDIALTVMGKSGVKQQVTWKVLQARVGDFAAGLRTSGVQRGDRIALLVPPSPELIALIYAAWKIGACVVIADSGLGARGIIRALKGAHPDHVIAIPRAMPLTRFLQVPGLRLSTRGLTDFVGTRDLDETGAHDSSLDGAVVFTSGSTGPAKGVRYTRERIIATVATLSSHYSLTDQDVIVAAFAPWAIFGPALGVGSVVPAMDIGAPSSLTYRHLRESVDSAHGTLLWASPAALKNVVKTATASAYSHPSESLRLILSAGAPVPIGTLTSMSQLFPNAELRTPYGMTEALPITDIDLDAIRGRGHAHGVPVGLPLPGVQLRIAPWGALNELSDQPDVMGEIVVRAGHMRSSYDNLAFTEAHASNFPGWHRTGDVGHLDGEGYLWVEGRVAHVITTAEGPITPVPIEQAVSELPVIDNAACVGVGPQGAQVVVVVVVLHSGSLDTALIDSVRQVAGVPVAAVLSRDELPTDIRHNAKINREQVAHWAAQVLAGTP